MAIELLKRVLAFRGLSDEDTTDEGVGDVDDDLDEDEDGEDDDEVAEEEEEKPVTEE